MKPAPATAPASGLDFIAAHAFPVWNAAGTAYSWTLIIAAARAAASLIRGCLATPIAELTGQRVEDLVEMLAVFDDPAAPSALANERLAALVDMIAADVPQSVAQDVAGQALDMTMMLTLATAVDGQIPAGSGIKLPDDVAFKVDPIEGAGLAPVAILAAAYRAALFSLSGMISIAEEGRVSPTMH